MKIPDGVMKLIQQHLGTQALAIQKREGRGAWIITPDSKARYVPQKDLSRVVEGEDVDSLLEMTRDYDPTKQVVFVFNVTDELQIIATVDIDESLV